MMLRFGGSGLGEEGTRDGEEPRVSVQTVGERSVGKQRGTVQ